MVAYCGPIIHIIWQSSIIEVASMVVATNMFCCKCHRMPTQNCLRLNCKLLKANSSPTSGICGKKQLGHLRNKKCAIISITSYPNFHFATLKMSHIFVNIALVAKCKNSLRNFEFKVSASLKLVHIDVQELAPLTSVNTFLYHLSFVDHFTSLHGCICYKINQKYLSYFKNFKAIIETQFHPNLKY